MGAGSSKTKSKLIRGKSEATVQTDVSISPSSPQSVPLHTDVMSTPQNRILQLIDPRSATAGIVRTPILVDCSTPKVVAVTAKPRYLETDLDEVLPSPFRSSVCIEQKPSMKISMNCGEPGLAGDDVAETSGSLMPIEKQISLEQQDFCEKLSSLMDSEIRQPEAHEDNQLTVATIETKIADQLFEKVIIDCEEIQNAVCADANEDKSPSVEKECAAEVDSAAPSEGLTEVSDGKMSEQAVSVGECEENIEELIAANTSEESTKVKPQCYDEGGCHNENEVKHEQNSPLNASESVSCSKTSEDLDTNIAHSSNNSRCGGECCGDSESWCKCDEATAVMLSSLRAIALKEPGEPTLPLPSLTESMNNELFRENSIVDWLSGNCDEQEVFVDEETKAVAEQLLALSQSVGAYSRQLVSKNNEDKGDGDIAENLPGMFNNALPVPQRNEGISLTHYNLPRPSPGPMVFEDPVDQPVTPKPFSNAVKKLHFTPELSDSEKRLRRPLGLVCGNVHDSGGSQASSKSQNLQDTPLGQKVLLRAENTPPRVGHTDVENTPPGRKSKPRPPYSARWNDNEATVFI